MTQNKATSGSAAEGFIGSILKYSISTFANVIIMALAIVGTTVLVPTEAQGQIGIFTSFVNTLMTIAILGLDQALIRFYYEPPSGLSRNGLFRVCFYFSSALLLVAGAVGSALLQRPLFSMLGFAAEGPFGIGGWVISAAFLNAFFFLIARYFTVLYRMEQNIRVYTVVSILMQFFFRLFYIVGAFLGFENPVPAMVLCSLLGLGGFAVVYSFFRRHTLRPCLGEFRSGGYRTLLPYGVSIAPTAVFVTLNSLVPKSLLGQMMGAHAVGVYDYGYTLSNVVTLVQGGFASFWGPYMFEHYKTEQARIKRVHNYLNLMVLCFFCLIVALEDAGFWLVRLIGYSQYAESQPIFPLMSLGAVFTILCETTVYGNYIARRPIFDTIGIGLSFGANVLCCAVLVPGMGLTGAGIAVAVAGFVNFFFRTLTGQKFYKSIQSPRQTAAAVALALAVTVAGTAFAYRFWLKFACAAGAILLYCLMYRPELLRLWQLAVGTLSRILKRGKT